MKKYQITKKECEQKIKGVCEGCGGKLEPIETVNNSGDPTFWVGCEHCSCFRRGVEKIYFEIARELVDKGIIIPYPLMERNGNSAGWEAYWLDSQTAGLSHNIVQIHRMIKGKEKS